jgi:hypothetical protein
MGGLQQKTSDKTGACLQKGSAEHGGYARGFTSVWITENNTVALPESESVIKEPPYTERYVRWCGRCISEKVKLSH